MESRPSARRVRFGPYDVDLQTSELLKAGVKVKIQPQPFQVLCALLLRAGDVVSRDDLSRTLWPGNTHVEFDANLNSIVKRLRRILGDDPVRPRYVETLPRIGYRFIFPVELIPSDASESSPAPLSVETVGEGSRIGQVLVQPARPTRDVVYVGLRRRRVEYALAGALVLLVCFLSYGLVSPEAESPSDVRRWSIAPDGLVGSGVPQISPDGRTIVYLAEAADGSRSLWRRRLDSEEPVRLASTTGAVGFFWAPDSRTVGFVADEALKAVSIEGEDAITICDLPNSRSFGGGTWSPDGREIIFSSRGTLYQVAAEGGEPSILLEPRDSSWERLVLPHFLPSSSGTSEAILFVAQSRVGERMVVAADLSTGVWHDLVTGMVAVYTHEGFLAYATSGGELMAVPFSPETLKTSGKPFEIAAGDWPSFSQDGTLVYGSVPNKKRSLVWRDRSTGKVEESVAEAPLMSPTISPDGNFAAAWALDSGNYDIWIVDLVRKSRTQLTFDMEPEGDPTWSPDGARIAYWSLVRDDRPGRIKVKSADGTGETLTLVRSRSAVGEPEWSPDGRYLAFSETSARTRGDISYVELNIDEPAAESEPLVFLDTQANEYAPQFSPKGGYLAYVSDETGREEVYVSAFPGGAGKQAVSTNGGGRPRWRADGRELYYQVDGTLMAVAVSATARGLSLGVPEPVFNCSDVAPAGTGFAVTRDGRKFLTVATLDESERPHPIRIAENWHEEFRRRP